MRPRRTCHQGKSMPPHGIQPHLPQARLFPARTPHPRSSTSRQPKRTVGTCHLPSGGFWWAPGHAQLPELLSRQIRRVSVTPRERNEIGNASLTVGRGQDWAVGARKTMRRDGTNKHQHDLTLACLTGPCTISPCCEWRPPSSTQAQTMGTLCSNLNVEYYIWPSRYL